MSDPEKPPQVMAEEIHLEILPPPALNSQQPAEKPAAKRRSRSRKATPVASAGDAAEDVPAVGEDPEAEPIPDDVFGPPREADAPMAPLVESVPKGDGDQQPKSGPPSAEEWQRFLGRVVLRTLTQGYIALMLGELEDELSPREREMITLSKEDLMEMAAPLASYATKNKFTRKHGREIIAATESYESIIVLVLWMRRVNRIAKRHKMAHAEYSQGPVEGQVIPEGYNGNGRPNGAFSQPGAGFPEYPVSNPGVG